MAYIGKQPNTAIVNQATSQSFSGNGSTTFTLNRSVNVGEDLEVFVNNVQQEPGSGKSYTASGTTLTFDEAPPSGTNNIYVIYRGEATINPRLEHDANAALAATTGTFSGDLTVDTDTLKVDSSNNRLGVGTASPSTKIHLNESGSANAVQRVQAGTNGYAAQVHLYGNNVGGSAYNAIKSFVNGDSTPQWEITGPEASAEDVMTLHTGGSERVRIDASGRVTEPSQPSFVTRVTASTTTAGEKWPTNGTPQHNTGNHWSTTTHRFTAPIAGRYLLLCSGYTNFTPSYGYMNLYINGTNQGAYSRHFNHNNTTQHDGLSMNVIWNLNANDYVEWGRGGGGGGYFDIVNVGAYLLG